MITSSNFIDKWNEAVGFDFKKLLEDDQNVSLPMITWMNSESTLEVLVYSLSPKRKTLITQKHFWNSNGHRLMLCRNEYASDMAFADNEAYVNALALAADHLFKEELTVEGADACRRYFEILKAHSAFGIYLAENKPLVQWAKKIELI